jgi:hypothetical protein
VAVEVLARAVADNSCMCNAWGDSAQDPGDTRRYGRMPGFIILWLLLSPFLVIGCLKGRYALSIAGLFLVFGIPTILAATRLARADSWWAKRNYDDEQLARASDRYRSGSGISNALTL